SFINMVPSHPFNELKPNSGCATGPRLFNRKKQINAALSSLRKDRSASLSSFGRFVADKVGEPLPHVARFVEMTGHALCAPADGKCEATETGHNGEYRFVGDIVADEDRTAALEGFVGHQF